MQENLAFKYKTNQQTKFANPAKSFKSNRHIKNNLKQSLGKICKKQINQNAMNNVNKRDSTFKGYYCNNFYFAFVLFIL